MPRQTFTWNPDMGAQQSCKPNVTQTKFGDGYEVRQPMGLNHQPMRWSLRFERTRDEGQQILDFLRARAGHEAFDWTNPLNEAGVYVCREWRTELKRGAMLVSCDFEQVFEY